MRLFALGVFIVIVLGSSFASARSISVGTAQTGKLINGFELPESNAWINFYRKVSHRGSNYATLEMAALLTRASRVVHKAVGGTLLTIGDCSDHDGGDLRGHNSHNSGRDVDILFYVKNKRGKSIKATGFHKFDKSGWTRRGKKGQQFDVSRNWWLVRTLLISDAPSVQYIFVADHLKKMMLSYAKKHGEAKEIMRRARSILVQPRDALPHDDHFHVRIYCSDEDRINGCLDTGPLWSWVKR